MSTAAPTLGQPGLHCLDIVFDPPKHVQDPAKSLSSHPITAPYHYEIQQYHGPRPPRMIPESIPRPVLPPLKGTMDDSRRYLTEVLLWEFHDRGLTAETEYIQAVNKCCITTWNLRRLVIAGAGIGPQEDWGKSFWGGDKFGLKQLENVLVYYGFTNSQGLMPAARLFRTAVIKHIERAVMKEVRLLHEAKQAKEAKEAEEAEEAKAREVEEAKAREVEEAKAREAREARQAIEEAEEVERLIPRHRFGPFYNPLKNVKRFIVEKFRRYLF